MNGAPFQLAGTPVVADPAGALYVPGARALLVADLHLEKGSALAAAGAMLPPYDSRQTLTVLERVVRHYAPEAVYCLGDSFHDPGGVARLGASEAARLERLARGRRFVWVAGNHDAGRAPEIGEAVGEARLGRLELRHEAVAGASVTGEVSGHFHPKAAVRARGRLISGRCFATDGRRLILPALGAYAGGLDVTDPAIASLFGPQFKVFVMVRERLVAFTNAQLARPRARRANEKAQLARPRARRAEENSGVG